MNFKNKHPMGFRWLTAGNLPKAINFVDIISFISFI